MKKYSVLLWVLTTLSTIQANDQMIPVLEKEGRAYVSATALEHHAGIAIKSLPGQQEIAACFEGRCALVNGSLHNANEILVPIDGLAEALGATAGFDPTRQKVRFQMEAQTAKTAASLARVGQLAPDFRLTRLDGSSVALSDFRGKRVVINSWASW